MKKNGFLAIGLFFVLILAASYASALSNVTLTNPTSNSLISGTVTLSATESDGDAQSMAFIYGNYSCTNSTANQTSYSCALDTTTIPDGVYTFYANATNPSGSSVSPQVTNVTVKNTPSYGVVKWMDSSSDLTSLVINVERELEKTKTLKLKNVGSSALSVSFSHSINLQDDDENNITLDFDPATLTISAGETKDVTLTINAEEEQELKSYTGSVTATETANATNSASFNLEIRVKPNFCEEGVVGSGLRLSVNEPDGGENFKPGDKVSIEADVKNRDDDDMDVRVKAYLFDSKEEIASADSSVINIDEDEEESFDLSLDIPTDSDQIDEGSYKLYVIAYDNDEEDENCIMEETSIDVRLEDEDVLVEKAEFSEEEAGCGETATLHINLLNIGIEDLEDVFVKLENAALKINKKSEKFDLEEFDSEDNSKELAMDVAIPSDAKPGEYSFFLQVNFEDEEEPATAKLQVVCKKESNKTSETKTSTSDVKTSLAKEIKIGTGEKTLVIPIIIENAATGKREFEISVAGIASWGEITSIEQPQALNPGDKSHAYIYMDIKEGVSGVHDLTINVKSGSQLLKSDIITVTIGNQDVKTEPISGGAVVEGMLEKEKTFVGGLVNDTSDIFWIIGDILLLVVGLFLIKALFRRD